ncbi:SGNH/GDSL hydrolase family protein [Psychrobacter sp. CAM01]|uniref:SGNH/GDSL hydrolase family protein n=1 Tax=Psychrobacter sp. CAM01 TaxID=3080335 RepID=UPI002936B2C9|nr:SGNH/GDSL hydrolase family protein [Psychrobacter sp. CAM01]MDV2860352.1 SGNH/GDSL hydrolase family protein [Psychrobacter sp. CAM01]
MAEPITMQKLTDASIDADTLGEFTNEDKTVVSRNGREYPSAPMASRLLVENGLLGATPFSTHVAMTASALADGDYAIVTNDDDIAKNGFYQKNGDYWEYLKYQNAPRALSSLQLLKKRLSNPLRSVQIRLIGDSITWGVGSSGTSSDDDRAHSLDDPRNNLDNDSWANLLRRWIGGLYFDQSALIKEPRPDGRSSGSGYYEKTFLVDPADADSGIDFYDRTNGRKINKSNVVVIKRSSPILDHHVDIANKTSASFNNNAYVEFDLVGDNFTVIYAGQPDGTSRVVDVYDNDVKIGEFDYSSPVSWSLTKSFDLDFGRHRISLRNRSTDGGIFRLEAIQVTQKMRMINDGISGTWTYEWLPSQNGLFNAISESDEFVFVMLGTNDRSQNIKPLTAQKTKNNLRIIANTLISTGKQVVLMSANAASATDEAKNRKYSQGDVSRVTQELAAELGVDFINNYAATVQAKIDGVAYTDDGLHPNDLGHKMIFENICNAVITA